MTKNYNTITKFEQALAEFTGAPYVVATDCCTHAIELCLLTPMYLCHRPCDCWEWISNWISVCGWGSIVSRKHLCGTVPAC